MPNFNFFKFLRFFLTKIWGGFIFVTNLAFRDGCITTLR